MLRAIMAVSADGLVSCGPDDDMSWTGSADKQLFRAQTEGCVLGAGTTTFNQLPHLPGRRVVQITRSVPERRMESAPLLAIMEDRMVLGDFYRAFPDGWLIGGQTVLLSAIMRGFVDRVILSHVQAEIGKGTPDKVTTMLARLGWSARLFPQGELDIVTWTAPHGA